MTASGPGAPGHCPQAVLGVTSEERLRGLCPYAHWTGSSLVITWLAGRIYMEARDRHGLRNISDAGTLDLFSPVPCSDACQVVVVLCY